MDEVKEYVHLNVDFSKEMLSHSHIVGPARYVGCSFETADMNGIRFDRIAFDRCSFDSADMSSSEFSQCEFIDCHFKHTSLSTSVFSGCNFDYSSGEVHAPFCRASLNSSLFTSCGETRTQFFGVTFSDISFRHLSFINTDFIDCDFENVPFEGASFKSCTFDRLDLRSGTIKGIQFQDTRCNAFKTIIEKTFSITGLIELIENADIEIHKDSVGGKVLISNFDGILELVKNNKDGFAIRGCLYEYLNCVVTEHQLVHSELLSTTHKSIGNTKNDIATIVELSIPKFTSFSSKHGRVATLANINFALNVLVMLKCSSTTLLSQIINLIEIAKEYRYSFQHLSEVFLKFETLKCIPASDYICLSFKDSSCQKISYSESSSLSMEISHMMESCEIMNYSIHSRSEGSIIEKLLLRKKDIIESYPQFIGVLLLLGMNMNFSSSSNGVEFNVGFNLRNIIGTNEPAIEEVISEVNRIQNIENTESVINILKLNTAVTSIRSMESLANKINSGNLSISSNEATIDQVLTQESKSIFLLQN